MLAPSLNVPPTPSATPVALPPPAPRRRTLLIVDDEEGPRQSLRVVFKNEYDLIIVDDGAKAIEAARQQKMDVAILDIRMTGMSGIEVLQGLKAVDPHTEVIMLTAYETIDTVRQALRLGACDYLNKPFDIPALRTAVANAMERRSLSFELKANTEKLRELSDELQNQRLEEALVRNRGEIYASIIHDINNPLTIMSGFLQLINTRIGDSTKIEGEDLENLKDRLRRITKQVTNCIDISRRYLSFMRKKVGESDCVSVRQSLADLDELLRVHPAVKDNELIIAPLAEDVMVPVNGTELIQIVRNLMVNALQCTPTRHRVELRTTILHAPLNVGVLTDGPEQKFINRDGFRNTAPLLVLTVADTGTGIAPEHMRKIFTETFTTQEAGHGTGLGLSIVQRLVARAGGGIHVRTRVGQGTEFVVYLPM